MGKWVVSGPTYSYRWAIDVKVVRVDHTTSLPSPHFGGEEGFPAAMAPTQGVLANSVTVFLSVFLFLLALACKTCNAICVC